MEVKAFGDMIYKVVGPDRVRNGQIHFPNGNGKK